MCGCGCVGEHARARNVSVCVCVIVWRSCPKGVDDEEVRRWMNLKSYVIALICIYMHV